MIINVNGEEEPSNSQTTNFPGQQTFVKQASISRPENHLGRGVLTIDMKPFADKTTKEDNTTAAKNYNCYNFKAQ